MRRRDFFRRAGGFLVALALAPFAEAKTPKLNTTCCPKCGHPASWTSEFFYFDYNVMAAGCKSCWIMWNVEGHGTFFAGGESYPEMAKEARKIDEANNE